MTAEPESEPQRPADERFAYGADYSLELGPSGFRAPRWPGRGEEFVAYREITHIAVEPRVVSIGTQRSVVLLNRARLGFEAGAAAFARAVLARIEALPDGAMRRDAFDRLDRKLAVNRRPIVAAILVALSALAFGLQEFVPGFYDAAIYRPELLQLGESWRYATTQLLHVNFGHLAVNAVAALVAGSFLERAIGRMGMLFVIGASAAGTMLLSQFGHYGELLGASGIAAGFFGALTALEFLAPGELPAPVRIPRAILVGVLLLQVALDSWVPGWLPDTAGLAHIGGFLAGGLAALCMRASARKLVLVGAAATAIAATAALGAVARQLVDPADGLVRRARAQLARPIVSPGEANNLAWGIATSESPNAQALALAEQLASDAVMITGRREPTLLDTLAEVYFAQGRSPEAIATIDEALALAPGVSYYEEQRRRFSGARAAEDRPEAPAEPSRTPASPEAPDDFEQPPPPGEFEFPPGDEVTV